MGFFDNLSITRALDTLNPFSSGGISFVNPVTGTQTALPGLKTAIRALDVAGGVYLASLAAPTLVNSAITTVKAAIGQASPQSKVIAGAAAALTVPGIVVTAARSPDQASGAILAVPAATNSFAKDVTNLGLNPTLQNAKDTLVNNKAMSAIALGSAGVAVGAVTAPVIASFLNTRAIEKNTSGAGVLPPAAMAGSDILWKAQSKYMQNASGIEEQAQKAAEQLAADQLKAQIKAQGRADDLAEANQKATIALAKQQLELQAERQKAELKIAEKAYAPGTPAIPSSNPIPTPAPVAKKKPKKKAKKKAAPKKKKKKSVKKKKKKKKR